MDAIVLVMFAGYFLLTAGIGYMSSRGQKNMSDFYVGGRSMGPYLIAFSACATIASGFFFVGLPGLAYLFGYQPMLQIPVNALLAYVVIFGLLGKPMRVLSEKYDLITVPDLFEKVYGSKALRWISSVIIILGIFGFMVSQWVAMGLLFQTLLNSTYVTGLIVGVIVVGFYVTVGGQKGTMWISAIQISVMMVGAVLAMVFGFREVGGFTAMNNTLASYNPEVLKPWSESFGLSIWSYISFFIVYAIGTVGQPHVSTRFFAIDDVKRLRWTPAISAVAYVFITLFLFTGMAYKAAEIQGIVPALENPDMVVGAFLVHFIPGGLGGIIMAAAVSAIMSTVAAFILVAASTIIRDFLQKGLNKEISGEQGIRYSRIATAVICFITFLLALNPPDLVAWIGNAAFGFFAAGLGPALVAAVRWRRATKEGAIASMLIGSITSFTLYMLSTFGIFQPKLDGGAIAFIVGIVVMVTVSLATPQGDKSMLPAKVVEQG
ncbi:MAG: sodium/proline symporter [Clostridiaceae bacterium]|nr:sodium/proline symporter [Clostridiaceae bacterium]